ncbi:hypothetical protein AN213_01942 [Pseudoalteromonas sp. P1-8]|nr:hypothetical protein AN213_01942 [Pseudoalteromonas sp. P1-8]
MKCYAFLVLKIDLLELAKDSQKSGLLEQFNA